jgi:signal transduction histidine kinase
MSSDAASISGTAFRGEADGVPRVYLSTSGAAPGQRRLALGVVVLSALIFAAAAPFAKTTLPAIPAFLPIHQSALVIIELITAVLLFGQFSILRSRALLVLASAYLFSAAMAVAHLLSFPGLFAPGGLLGAGPQTTAWLYFLWHGGFPLLVIAYAVLKEDLPERTAEPPSGTSGTIAASVALVLAVAGGLILLTTAMHDGLPEIMRGDRDASTKILVAAACWALSLAALPVLWRRQPHSLVDLWLMVTVCVWIFEIALASVLNGGRYDLGWYGGRIYGLFAASFVLAALLLENSVLHAQVARGQETERRQAREALNRHEERLRIVHEIDRAIIAGAKPEAIAAAVLQPLRHLISAQRLNINMIDYAAGELEWLAAAGRRRTHVGSGVRFPMHMIGDLDALRRGEAQRIDTGALPPSPQRELLLAAGVRHYMAVPMIAGGELIGALSFGGEQASFPQEQVTMVQEVATQLAVAIGQARLFEQSKRSAEALARQAERLRIVHEIDRSLIGEVDLQALAAAVLQPLRELLGVPRVVVNVFDLAAGEVEWLAAAGRRRMHVGPGVRYPLSYMGELEALKRGEPQVIDTHALPPGPATEALLASGVRVYMAVPMIAGGELIGALSFGGELPEFPPEQVTIAKEVATQLAIAITQARLFERVRRHAEELEQRVKERTAALEAANKELESFSYSVSHDLRAPLRAVDGYAQMLVEDYGERLDDEGRRLLGVVRASAEQMGRLIDDLLKFSQVGRRALARGPVDMRALASEVAAELAPANPKAHVELGALPALAGDRALLRHVWSNLIGNALKYSARKDTPLVQISGRAEGAENIYTVRDNGAGFDMRYYDKLFNVFQRLHREDEFEGTGVGLAIVQRVVVRHGGRVWGEGAIGEGASFHFALPREAER